MNQAGTDTEQPTPPWEEAATHIVAARWPLTDVTAVASLVRTACEVHAAAITRERDEARAERDRLRGQLDEAQAKLQAATTALNEAGIASGNEHVDYNIPERIKWLADGRDYFTRQTDKARAEVEALRGQLETAVKEVHNHVCVHHNDAERAAMRCPICLATENAAQRALLDRAWHVLTEFGSITDQSRVGWLIKDISETLRATPPPAAGAEAMVPAEDVEPLLAEVDRLMRSSFTLHEDIEHPFDNKHFLTNFRTTGAALAAYRAKHPKPETKGTA